MNGQARAVWLDERNLIAAPVCLTQLRGQKFLQPIGQQGVTHVETIFKSRDTNFHDFLTQAIGLGHEITFGIGGAIQAFGAQTRLHNFSLLAHARP